MGIYKELDIVIADYVGYKEDGNSYECADPELYDQITQECSKHRNGELPLDKISKDAQYCITEWESILTNYNEYEQLARLKC